MVSSFTHMRTWGGGWIYHDYTALAAYSPTEDIKKALLAESMAQMRILDLKRDTWVKREKAIWDLEDLRDLHRSQGIDFIRLRAEYELSAIAQAERIASERASERASELASKPRSRLRMPWLPQLPKVNRKLGGKRIGTSAPPSQPFVHELTDVCESSPGACCS